jgi:hypothetical protein
MFNGRQTNFDISRMNAQSRQEYFFNMKRVTDMTTIKHIRCLIGTITIIQIKVCICVYINYHLKFKFMVHIN